MKNSTYHYFVSYAVFAAGSTTGFGNAGYTASEKIKTIDDVGLMARAIEREAKEQKGKDVKVSIISFKLLRVERNE